MGRIAEGEGRTTMTCLRIQDSVPAWSSPNVATRLPEAASLLTFPEVQLHESPSWQGQPGSPAAATPRFCTLPTFASG